jgi:SAM-dependent methyltransferase
MDQSAASFNEALYDQFWASCPDFSRFNPGVLHRRRAITKRLRSLEFQSLLDVGCGNGELIMWLRERLPASVNYTGVDLSSKTVEANVARHPYANFHVLNVEQAHLDKKFDAVVCTEVIEHLDDRRAAMSHICAMVAPGGHLVVTCPTGKVHATERHFGHTTHPTVPELRRLTEDAGLEVVSLDNWGFPLYTGLKYATNVRPEWALRSFASGKYDIKAKVISKALYFVNFLNPPTTPVGCQLFLVARKPT